MSILLKFRGGPLAGKKFEFGDEVEEIVVGRDPKCQLVLPADMTDVGRQHCSLRLSLGRYRLVVNRDNPVYVDGKPAADDMELAPVATIQFGKDGPKLVAQTQLSDQVPETVRREKAAPGVHTRLGKAEASTSSNRKVVMGSIGLVVVLGIVGFFAFKDVGDDMAKLAAGVEKDVQSALSSYDEELESIKGTLDEDKQALARLVVERGERAKQLEALKKRQGLDESDRRRLEKKLQEKLADTTKELEKLNDRVAKSSGAGAKWEDIAGKYEKGIFLFVCEFEGGAWSIGTGFCIRNDGLLATNSHVARDIEDAKKAVAYQNVTGKGFKIKRFKIHPRYSDDAIFQPDVALVQLESAGGFGSVPVLPIGGEDDLRGVTVGAEIGTLGYPGEMMQQYVIARSDAQAPKAHATFKSGLIGRVTGYDLVRRGFETGHLIQHSALTTGGTSGSPLISVNGKVVGLNHAGRNMTVLEQFNRPDGTVGTRPKIVSDTSGIRWGVRADELKDLLTSSGW